MNVNPISVSDQSFKGHYREDLREFTNLDDKSLKYIAMDIARDSKSAQSHRKKSNRLFYSIPLAAALSAVVANPVVGKYARLGNIANFVSHATNLYGALAVFGLATLGMQKLSNSSKKVREFNQNHPVLATVATIGSGIAAIALAAMGMGKLNAKAVAKYASESEKAIANKVIPHFRDLKSLVKLNNKINNSTTLNTISKWVGKAPKSLKTVAKIATSWSPWILLGASLSQSVAQAQAQNRDALNIYSELKKEQEIASAKFDGIVTSDDI